MKALLLAVCGLVLSLPGASAGIVILSGGLTTSAASVVEDNPVDGNPAVSAATRTTEKNYLVLDVVSGQYQLLRLFRQGAAKKVAVAFAGTVKGLVLPGDAKNKTTRYSYYQVDYSNQVNGMFGTYSTSTFHLDGIASAAVGENIALGVPFPSTMTLARHLTRDDRTSTPFGDLFNRNRTEETGKLSLDRALSKAANTGSLDLTSAVNLTYAALAKLGYTP